MGLFKQIPWPISGLIIGGVITGSFLFLLHNILPLEVLLQLLGLVNLLTILIILLIAVVMKPGRIFEKLLRVEQRQLV